MPLKSDFKEAVGANPDLYGPIWINATLILLIAASGNLVNLNTVYINKYWLARRQVQYWLCAMGYNIIVCSYVWNTNAPYFVD